MIHGKSQKRGKTEKPAAAANSFEKKPQVGEKEAQEQPKQRLWEETSPDKEMTETKGAEKKKRSVILPLGPPNKERKGRIQ